MESLDNTRREERLGKKLVAFYGLTISCGDKSCGKDTIKISDPKCSGYAVFTNWHYVLFRTGLNISLNDAITGYFNYFRQKKIGIIDYSSLDELDIQLTLLGVNGK